MLPRAPSVESFSKLLRCLVTPSLAPMASSGDSCDFLGGVGWLRCVYEGGAAQRQRYRYLSGTPTLLKKACICLMHMQCTHCCRLSQLVILLYVKSSPHCSAPPPYLSNSFSSLSIPFFLQFSTLLYRHHSSVFYSRLSFFSFNFLTHGS